MPCYKSLAIQVFKGNTLRIYWFHLQGMVEHMPLNQKQPNIPLEARQSCTVRSHLTTYPDH